MKYNLINEQNSVSISGLSDDVFLKATLKDQCCNIKKQRKIPIRVVGNEEGTLDISIKGYDFNHNNGIITLEIWDGQLRLLVWADRNSEEPTHIINLEGAKEIKKSYLVKEIKKRYLVK